MSRFKQLSDKLQKKGESKHEADAVAAIAGRKKYGEAGMKRKAEAGRRRARGG